MKMAKKRYLTVEEWNQMQVNTTVVPLQVNTTVCCKVKGGRFLATITEIIVESAEVCLN